MNSSDFIKTIYLGDRACKGVVLDGWNSLVKIHVDNISRIRSLSGNWEFYTDEDIENGFIVFEFVESIRFTPPGLIPNDAINYLQVEDYDQGEHQGLSKFKVSIDSVNPVGENAECVLEIIAKGIYLEDPKMPQKKIVD